MTTKFGTQLAITRLV